MCSWVTPQYITVTPFIYTFICCSIFWLFSVWGYYKQGSYQCLYKWLYMDIYLPVSSENFHMINTWFLILLFNIFVTMYFELNMQQMISKYVYKYQCLNLVFQNNHTMLYFHWHGLEVLVHVHVGCSRLCKFYPVFSFRQFLTLILIYVLTFI